ncbi:MAG: hypothetical protein HQ582_25125 [Planctomycetes bacterium]|nr:hypothetical protein [Planctomycetota bacterium]
MRQTVKEIILQVGLKDDLCQESVESLGKLGSVYGSLLGGLLECVNAYTGTVS